MERQNEKRISLEIGSEAQSLFGIHDEYSKLIEDSLQIQLLLRDGVLTLAGSASAVDRARQVIFNLTSLIKEGKALSSRDIRTALRLSEPEEKEDFQEYFSEVIEVSPKKRSVRPKSLGQKRYIDAIRRYDMVLSIGPAGTGKTYLAMAMAVSSLLRKQISRIILTRPAVEAGERLGFLPGTLYEKINPYLRPLYDALYDMMESERVSRLLEMGTIEIAPLAFMRGRTLNDSFIILDEAQNTTSEQMKMFLTRLGFNSKAVITGDITQVDLPSGKVSGLIEVQSILKEVEGIKFVYLTEEDVIRHELVQRVIRAYESYQQSSSEGHR
ncbi:MAG: PhoH family protein [candidate division NC10 bacterium]|nr:PhoH family protein [candidate division NC10 bacterium]